LFLEARDAEKVRDGDQTGLGQQADRGRGKSPTKGTTKHHRKDCQTGTGGEKTVGAQRRYKGGGKKRDANKAGIRHEAQEGASERSPGTNKKNKEPKMRKSKRRKYNWGGNRPTMSRNARGSIGLARTEENAPA